MTSGPSMDQGLSCGMASWLRELAEEGEVPEAEHVEGGEQGSDEADEPESLAE